ncbi:mesoderm induction early response protein 1-like [Artemia franciscana]|uniref:mesoderm induction early response protein 1-like n=1 Tax=Artemia franciscana TaxID=6661 RepID=UPI0032DAEA8E
MKIYGYNKEEEPSLDTDNEPSSSQDVTNADSLLTDPIEEPESELTELYEEEKKEANTRFLRSGLRQPSDEEQEEGQDLVPDDEWRKTIMIGSDYQASVPLGLSPYGDALPYENEDKLVWVPKMKDEEVIEYLRKVQKIVRESQGLMLPEGAHIKDDEPALHLLHQCGYNVEEALRRKKMNAVPTADTMSLWSEEECRNFELGLRIYGKDFHVIQKHKVRTRSVGELIQFYYLWKKTERHDIFASKARLEKKKYALHPGTTDYMDKFLDEQEMTTSVPASRDRSTSPAYSLLASDKRRSQLGDSYQNNNQ